MVRAKRKNLTTSEQDLLEHGRVVLLSGPDDCARCDELIVEHHYLHDATLVGQHLRYAFVYKGQWYAVATWGAAARHLKARDEFIGWTAEQCRVRLSLIANNTRLLVLPERHSPNLISRFMKWMLARLSADWLEHWQHPLALVETFVDPQLYQGTAYKVSGWSHLGRTAGWKRDASDFYVRHDHAKQIWVRELVRRACQKLRAPALPPAWASVEAEVIARCTVKVPEMRSLMEHLLVEIPEFRRAEALAYPVAGLIALVVMAMATGVRKGPDDLALYADTLSQGQLRALRFRRKPGTSLVRCPKKTVFHTLLTSVKAETIERALLLWQNQLLGPVQDDVVLIDGKKMRGGAVEMVNASTGAGRFLGATMTADKSNEIPAARQVLQTLDLSGKIVVTDALHTNRDTAHQILYEQGGDYLLTVKGNQPELQKTLQSLFAQNVFSPQPSARTQVHQQENNCGRIEIRTLDLIAITPSQASFPGAQLAARLQTRVQRKGRWSDQRVYLISSRSLEQLQAEGMLRLKRGYWVIESRLHHCLDITLQEDLSRVRDPNAARTLGTIRRIVLALSNAALDRLRKVKPKTKANTKTYRQRFLSARPGLRRLSSLLFSKSPDIWSFGK